MHSNTSDITWCMVLYILGVDVQNVYDYLYRLSITISLVAYSDQIYSEFPLQKLLRNPFFRSNINMKNKPNINHRNVNTIH